VVLVASPGVACAAQCSRSQAVAAEAAVDQLGSWDAILAWYQRYRQCDDGGIAEGVSDAIEKLLARSWDTVPQLVRLGKRNRHFPEFVANHIGEITGLDNAILISKAARNACPKGAADFCSLLVKNIGDVAQVERQ